jgi:hypothetical protein
MTMSEDDELGGCELPLLYSQIHTALLYTQD